MVKNVVFNAKMRRTGICGPTETLLINKKINIKDCFSIVIDLINADCEIRLDKFLYENIAQHINKIKMPGGNQFKLNLWSTLEKSKIATSKDWDTEYLAPIISIKMVKDVKAAI